MILRATLITVLFWIIYPNIIFASNFGIRPAYPRESNTRTESIFIQTIEPGSFADDGVRIINNTGEIKNFLLYSEDSVRSSGGGFACKQLADPSTGVGTWIKFDSSLIDEKFSESIKQGKVSGTIEIIVPPNSEIIIPFKINVPANTSVGEHNGCILLQEIKEKDPNAIGVSLSLRSGIRVAVNVPGEIIKKLEINDFKIEKRNKSIYLMPSIKNTGNISIDTNVRVDVRYFFGAKHKTFGGQFPVLRDEIYDFNFEMKRPFWGGFYSAKAFFEYDEKSEEIGLSSEENNKIISSSKKWFFTMPTLIGLITQIFILLLLLFIFAIWRLNKKKKKWISRWVPYIVQEGETLETVSKKFRVHWEILVEVNKIKPPFVLKEGEEIRIPPTRRKGE